MSNFAIGINMGLAAFYGKVSSGTIMSAMASHSAIDILNIRPFLDEHSEETVPVKILVDYKGLRDKLVIASMEKINEMAPISFFDREATVCEIVHTWVKDMYEMWDASSQDLWAKHPQWFRLVLIHVLSERESNGELKLYKVHFSLENL